MASFDQFGFQIGGGQNYNDYMKSLVNNNNSGYTNQYYNDALKNPNNYTWGIWDSTKPLSPDNWQPKPRQAGDARDTSGQKNSNSQPVSVTSGVNNSNSNLTTSTNNSLDELTKQFYNNLNNNFADSLPKFNYSPSQGAQDQANFNQDAYNLQKRSLQDSQDLANTDAWQKIGQAQAASWQANQMAQQAANAKASREQFDRTNPNGKSFSFTTIADPNSREVQAINTMQKQQAQNKAYETNLLNDAEISKQSRLIPMQTQATIQTQAPQFASQQKVADIQAEASKAVAEASAKAQMYGSDATKQASMYGSDATVKAADINAIVQKAVAEANQKASMYGSDASVKAADINAQVQKAIADANRQAQMYGANLNAMSSMFGSQMGAVGSMFGGMNTGGNARYW